MPNLKISELPSSINPAQEALIPTAQNSGTQNNNVTLQSFRNNPFAQMYSDGVTRDVMGANVVPDGDPFWDNTVLLLHGDGANNAQNNTFLDSSSNNLAITRNGTPSQGSFSPFALNGVAYSPTLHGGSGYFNGTTDYLNAGNNSALDLRSGNFTMEAWIYPRTVSGSRRICGEWNNEQGVLAVQEGTLVFSWAPHSLNFHLLQSTTNILANNWTHVAVTRSTNTFTLYINGINVASGSSVDAAAFSQPFLIGAIFIPSVGIKDFFDGYISNLRVTKGLAVYTSNFTPPTSPVTLTSNGGATPSTAPTSGQVSLLCDFTNGGIIDHTEKNVLTTVGDTKVSTSVKKYGTGSMYFSSVNEKLTLPVATSGSGLDYGTGSFTIECWYNYASGGGFIITQTVSSNNNLVFAVDSTRAINVWLGHSNLGTSSAGVVPLNTWCHIALVRNGSSVVVYVNGSSVFTATNSSSIGGSMVPCINGYGHAAGYGNVCYIDDLRITKGVARYTSNFTPSTRAFPDVPPTASLSDPFWDNTVLLLHGDGANNAQNNTFLDSSSNNFTITRNGSVTQGSFSPFALNGVAYSPTLHGGSGSFNPSGTLTDYLTLAANSNFAFGTGDFTVEFWMYPTANSPWISLCGTQPAAITDSNGWSITLTNSTPEIAFWSSSKYIPAAISLNQWTHVSVTRSGTTLRMFINGTIANSTTNSENFTYNQFGVGCTGPGIQPYKGYISNLRVVKGAALYTSNFTPPTSPVTLTSNGGATPSTAPTSGQVSLLCNFTNGGIIDHTEKNVLTTVGDAKVSTSVVKYGTGSMYFDGTGDYLTMPDSNDFVLGTGNATIEFWIYPTALIQDSTIFAISTTANSNDCYLQMSSGGALRYLESGSMISTANLLNTNTWTHIAITRNGGTRIVYVNGTSAVTGSVGNITSNRCTVGAYSNGTLPIQGYIDDFRITKGVARYTANFTPPTRAFPDVPGSSDLLTKWYGGILAPNGEIYGIPRNSSSVLIIDPVTNTVSTFGAVGTGINKWNGGVLAPNGKIYGIPRNSSSVLVIDPFTNTVSTFGAVGTDTDKWNGGVLAPNGKIYGIPANSTSVLIIDPFTNTVSTFGSLGTGNKWAGGALAPNGRIYGIPYNSTSVLVIDPVTNTTSTFGSLGTGNKWAGGALAPNGRIYGIPYDNTSVLIIDPVTNTTSTIGSFSGTDKWNGGILAPNGEIYGIPVNSTSVLIIDPITNTTSIIGSLDGTIKWTGGVLAPIGKIYGIPSNSTDVLQISPNFNPNCNIPQEILLSAYYNKF